MRSENWAGRAGVARVAVSMVPELNELARRSEPLVELIHFDQHQRNGHSIVILSARFSFQIRPLHEFLETQGFGTVVVDFTPALE